MFSLPNSTSTDRAEGRLLILAALFLAFYSLALSLSPLVQARSLVADPVWSHWLGFAAWLAVFLLARRESVRRLPQRVPFLLPVAGLLVGWGMLTIYRLFPNFGLRQAVWMTLGMGILILGLRLQPDFRFLRRYKYLWLTGGLLLTGLTLFLGTNPLGYGPEMWLGCCGVYLQPSEPLKLLLIIYISAYLADRLVQPGTSAQAFSFGALLPLLAPTLIMTGLALLLLLIQRDLGTASIFVFLYTAIVYVATGRRRVALIGLFILVAASLAGYFLFDVVRLRFDAWLNPWLDPSGRSYQIVQSLLAVANGGIAGRGPGLGSPGVVPVPHSDFIFASVLEETGLIGAVGMVVLIGLMVYNGLGSALKTTEPFQRYLAAGLTAYLGGQSILIIAGNLRLLPLTGVTLPFVSYGGSSLLVSLISLLFLLLISNSKPARHPPAPDPRPVLHLGGLLLAGLALAGLMAGWWAVMRGPDLLARTDNPRRAISDRMVRRGALLDREDRPINQSQGEPGSYVRTALYPDLGPVAGYTDPLYGQAGLEASLDPYLRGLEGNSLPMLWWNSLVYGQPPPGLEVRTSLDLELQATADRLLQGHSAALVLLNANSGEILAMASHPTFNPNRLAELGDSLVNNPEAPLLNRTVQGLYPAGEALGPLLLAHSSPLAELPPLNASFAEATGELSCAGQPAEAAWPAAIQAGCPRPLARLAGSLTPDEMTGFFDQLGFYSAPQTSLPANSASRPTGLASYTARSDLRASPLQIALATASLSNGGLRPAPHLAMAFNEPERGWVILPAQESAQRVLPEQAAAETARALAVAGKDYWQSLAVAPDGEERVTWYLGGTLPGWSGTPLALVVLLEENNPALAEEIGQKVLLAGQGKGSD